jgi:hypothetical protein
MFDPICGGWLIPVIVAMCERATQAFGAIGLSSLDRLLPGRNLLQRDNHESCGNPEGFQLFRPESVIIALGFLNCSIAEEYGDDHEDMIYKPSIPTTRTAARAAPLAGAAHSGSCIVDKRGGDEFCLCAAGRMGY